MQHPHTDHAARTAARRDRRDAAIDDLLLEPEDDAYLDRCLFEIRETLADFRNV